MEIEIKNRSLFNHSMYNQNIPANSQPSDPENIKTFEIALSSKRQIAKDTWAFVFEKPTGFHFRAGQHIKMTLINFSGTNNEDHSRFFSVASTPAEANLTIAMRMGETEFKQILDRMPVGGKVKIEMRSDNIHPSFTLPNNPAKPAVFIIGGIGIVPAFSVIKDAFERKLSHEIFLFYSNRRPEDAPFLDDLMILEKQNPSFKLIATMTKPENSAHFWPGETGKIDYLMLTKYLNNLERPIYYIAGLSHMVSTMKTMLIDAGVNQNNIRTE